MKVIASGVFDLLHYGDLPSVSSTNIPPSTSVSNTVKHIVRHLHTPEKYGGIAELEMFKLTVLFEMMGVDGVIDTPDSARRLRSLVSDEWLSSNQHTQKLFLDFIVRKLRTSQFNKHDLG